MLQIGSSVVTDACQILWNCYLTDARIVAQFVSWFIKIQKMSDNFKYDEMI